MHFDEQSQQDFLMDRIRKVRHRLQTGMNPRFWPERLERKWKFAEMRKTAKGTERRVGGGLSVEFGHVNSHVSIRYASMRSNWVVRLVSLDFRRKI